MLLCCCVLSIVIFAFLIQLLDSEADYWQQAAGENAVAATSLLPFRQIDFI